MNKILTVYNICQKDKDNTDGYIKALKTIFNQNFTGHKVVISACRNYIGSLNRIKDEFRDKINIVRYSDTYPVQITFNKTVQECVKRFGNFEGYLYIESGVTLPDPNIIGTIARLMDENLYSMISIQTDDDNGLGQWFNFNFVTEKNFIIPVGRACNLHCQLFSNQLFETYDKKIIPDAFRAYCTESVFTFLNAVIKKKWVVAKDIIIPHKGDFDGRAAYVNVISERFGNSWNNFHFNRSAFDFINDPEARSAGLGYEELNLDLMHHKKDMFDENGFSIDPERLRKVILKYLYLSEQELDYNKIETSFI